MSFEERPLSQDVCVSPQIEIEDIPEILEAGFKSIIINRPDNEMPEQPSAEAIKQAAEAAGLHVRYTPMFPGQLTVELIQDMAAALETLPKPALAYCASGTRSTILWCCVNAGSMGVDGVLNSATAAGYNLEQFRPVLTQLSQ